MKKKNGLTNIPCAMGKLILEGKFNTIAIEADFQQFL